MPANPFEPVVVASRSAKPRTRGLTMIADWGMPLGQQSDVLSISAPYVDLAKVAVGIAALLPTEVLREKIHAYTERDIVTFPGGQFLEYLGRGWSLLTQGMPGGAGENEAQNTGADTIHDIQVVCWF